MPIPYGLKCALLAAGAVLVLPLAPACADTLLGSLSDAYRTNPTLNAQRASVRASTKMSRSSSQAIAPGVAVTATGGQQSLSTTTKVTSSNVSTPLGPIGGGSSYVTQSGYNSPVQSPAPLRRRLFNGFQTANRTRQAESAGAVARETLAHRPSKRCCSVRSTAYMNLLRDTAILDLQRRNVEVLQEQLRQTRDRFNVGEVTRTDVAQSRIEPRRRSLAGADRGSQLHRIGSRPTGRSSAPIRESLRRHAGRPVLTATRLETVGRGSARQRPAGARRRNTMSMSPCRR